MSRRCDPTSCSGSRVKQPWTDIVAGFYARPEVMRELTATIESWRATHHPTMRGHFTPLDLRQLHDLTTGASTPPLTTVPMWAVPPVDRHSAGALLIGITHTFPPALVELLLSRGFDCRSARVNGRRLVSMAIRGGRREVADLLRSHGAPDDDVTPCDELIGACLRLDRDAARAVVSGHPELGHHFSSADFDTLAAAARSSLEHLRLMLNVGVPAGGRGTAGVTALHLAAWHGRVDAVRLLLDHEASTDARDSTYDATPREWAVHGATHCRTAEDEYREVLNVLGAS